MVSSENREPGGVDPQFQMFDKSPREHEIGTLAFEHEVWTVVLQTRECADRLYRGKLLFRCQGRELRTTDLFVEASQGDVVARAAAFEPHLMRDLLRSLI